MRSAKLATGSSSTGPPSRTANRAPARGRVRRPRPRRRLCARPLRRPIVALGTANPVGWASRGAASGNERSSPSWAAYSYGLRRVGTKGRAAAPKARLLSASADNLQKLLQHQPKQVARVASARCLGQLALYPQLCSPWLPDSTQFRVRLLAEPIPHRRAATATVDCELLGRAEAPTGP